MVPDRAPEDTPGVHVFLGPSLALDVARSVLPACYHPPAAHGDLYAVAGATTVVLIDGVFLARRAVWQREVLALLDAGTRVVGASSMGALRGAELAAYGMEGVGTVFGWYRDGTIDGDDEVAMIHGDASVGYRPMSEPLVNVRATVAAAIADGVVDAAQGDALLARARATWFPDRSLEGLGAHPEVTAWLRAHRVDVKREDALLALRRVAEEGPREPLDARPPPSAWSPSLHQDARLQLRLRPGVTGAAVVARVLADPTEQVRRWCEATGDLLLTLWAESRDLRAPEAFVDAFVARREPALDAGALRANGLTHREWQASVRAQATLAWLTRGPDPLAARRALLAAWAEAEGIHARAAADPVDALFERGPLGLGLGVGWSFELAVLRQLQLRGEAATIAASLA